MNKITKSKSIKGFTMVETLVAVAILMISVAGPLTIAQKGLLAAIYARDQVTASFLALDAMEFIKNVRDNNMNQISNNLIPPSDWLANIYVSGSKCNAANNVCKIDTTIPSSGTNPETCNSPATCILYNDGSGYKTTGAKTTQFSRSYYIINENGTEATAVVNVNWFNGTVENSVKLENQLFYIIR